MTAVNPGRTGLVEWWKFEEASGVRTGSHAGKTTGTGGGGGQPVAGTGKFGNGADFESSSSNTMQRSSDADVRLIGTSFTVSGWFNPETVTLSRLVLSFANPGTGDNGWRFTLSGGVLQFTTLYDGTGRSVNSTVALSAGNWYHFMATWDSTAGQMSLSVNNETPVLSASGLSAPKTHTGSLFIGCQGASFYFDGVIDSLSLWNVKLTDDNREWLYNGGTGYDYEATANDYFTGYASADIGTTTSQTYAFGTSSTQRGILAAYTPTDPYLDSFAVEADLGAGYVDITADINMQARIVAEGGIRSPQFIDLLASSGRMVFQLDNTSSNSGAVYGYYTPGHANARAGWDEGVPIRLKIVHNSITTYKWQGWVTRVEPTVGQFRRPVVNVTAEDWLGVAARTGLKQQALQLNKRADEVITDVVDDMDLQPVSRSLAVGQETFTQALDSDRDERDTVYSVFSKLTRSEIGRVFMTQDSTGGGVLRFEDRHYRLLTDSGDRLITFDNTMDDMQVEYRRESIYNEIRVKTFPRNIGLVPEILADLTNKPSIQPGSTLTLTLNYRDPQQQAQRISGKDMIAPVSDSDNTDYIFGSVNDGVTDDLDSDITLTVAFGANSALVSMENTGTQAAFVNKLQLRGTAIRLFDPIIAEASDSDSVALRGRITLDFDMPYQQDPLEGESFANYLRDQLATPKKRVARLMFLANKDQDMLEAAVRGNVSSRFRIQEGQSAIAQDYFINAWKMTIGIGGRVDMEWIPADADEQGYWILGTSTLGETTYLGV